MVSPRRKLVQLNKDLDQGELVQLALLCHKDLVQYLRFPLNLLGQLGVSVLGF